MKPRLNLGAALTKRYVGQDGAPIHFQEPHFVILHSVPLPKLSRVKALAAAACFCCACPAYLLFRHAPGTIPWRICMFPSRQNQYICVLGLLIASNARLLNCG